MSNREVAAWAPAPPWIKKAPSTASATTTVRWVAPKRMMGASESSPANEDPVPGRGWTFVEAVAVLVDSGFISLGGRGRGRGCCFFHFHPLGSWRHGESDLGDARSLQEVEHVNHSAVLHLLVSTDHGSEIFVLPHRLAR